MLVPHKSGSYLHPDDPGEPTTGDPRLSVTDLEAEILAALVIGRHVVEIGTGLGVSATAMARTAASVTTVDIDEWVHENIWPVLPSNVTGATELPAGRTFDAAFIDGAHDTASVIADLARIEPLVAYGGLVIAHDAGYDSVRKGLGDGWHYIATPHGIAVRRT